MNGKANIETSPAKARRFQRSRAADASCRFKQRGLCHPIRTGNKTALRRCHAVQHPQQRCITGLMALHERETGLDFCRCTEQGQVGIDSPRLAGADGTGSATQQSKLVRPDVVRPRQHQRVGSLSAIMAAWRIRPLETIGRHETEAKAAPSEKHNVLSVVRTHRPLYMSVHRTNRNARMSVHRTYRGCFLGFPMSVQRTPTSNTTPPCEFRKEITKWL